MSRPVTAMLDGAERYRGIRRVLAWTLGANLVVVAAKLAAGIGAGALSVVADAAHSSIDAWNNVMGLALSAIAAKAPDEEHPYGHAKFETLGAIGVVVFLSISVYELTGSAFARLVSGESRPQITPWVVAAMLLSAMLNFFVARWEHRRGEELNSDLLVADAAHTRSDVYASLAVLVGLGLVALGYPRADAAFTLFVAAVIARAGWRIIRRTVPVLVDERAVAASAIRRIALETDGVLDAYDVRSRGRTGEVFAELTITVAGDLNIEHAHDIADAVERRIAQILNAREVVVHMEPAAARRSS
jgi:cation diffusion facilitator family transporter